MSKPKKTVANEEEVVVETDDEETNDEVQEPVQTSQYEHEVNEDDVDQIIYDHPSVLPWRDASIKFNVEETSNLDVNVDTNIINNETTSTTTLELNTIIPPEGPTKKTNTNEVSSLDISGNLSNKDSNVNMGKTPLKDSSITQPPQ